MPKMTRDYPARMDVSVTQEMYNEVLTIAYHMGAKGKYAKAVRPLLRAGINAYLEDLSKKKRATYDRIYSNVLLMTGDDFP